MSMALPRWNISGVRSSHLIKCVMFFVSVVVTCSAATNLFQRVGSEAFGRDFYIVLPVEQNTRIPVVHNIFISSRSRLVVPVNVSRLDSTSWHGPSINVQPSIVANVSLNMSSSVGSQANRNGVPIRITAADDVTVWACPGWNGTVLGGYRVIPRDALGANYVGTLYPGASSYRSEIVALSLSDSLNEIQFIHENSNLTAIIDTEKSVLPSVVNLPPMETVRIISSSDLSGLALSAIDTLSVTSSRVCRNASVPEKSRCADLMEQVPPLGTWGRAFIVVSQAKSGNPFIRVRIVSAINNTVVTIFRPTGSKMYNRTLYGEHVVEDIEEKQMRAITIRADKPILVTQFFIDRRERMDFASMVSIPPVEQFTNASVVFPVLNHTIFQNNLLVITRCEHRRDILLNGKDIHYKFTYQVQFNDDLNSSVHGTYCLCNITRLSGSHTLALRADANVGAVYAAILYGTGESQAYAYQVAGDLREIVCGFEGQFVELCDYYVPPDFTMETTLATVTSNSSEGNQTSSSGHGHKVGIVIVIVIMSVMAIVIGVIILVGNYGKNKGSKVSWRRLGDTSEIKYDASFDDEEDVPMDDV